MTPRAALQRGLDELALGLAPGAVDQLLAYIDLLVKWNRTYNLTAIAAPLDMVPHHLLDSLAVLPHLPLPAQASLADVGSGAGLPGIPLAIARPRWRLALNDSSQKRTAFLRQAAMTLGLRNVDVRDGRAQDWHPAAPYDAVISRAFAKLAQFLAATRHLLARDGLFAAMKGAHPAAELSELPAGCRCEHVLRLQVPLLRAQRHLVLCRMHA